MLMQNEVSGLGRRTMAVLVDLFMLKLADIPLSRTLREVTPSPLVALIFEFCILVIYSTIFVSRRGQTPGKIMAALRVISADGGVVTQGQAFVRAMVKWTPLFAVVIAMSVIRPFPVDPSRMALDPNTIVPQQGPVQEEVRLADIVLYGGLVLWFILVAITRKDADRRGLHDRIAGTLVMRVP